MSLPLTRRIARAALVVAAGTAPVVGAAGAASAVELPSTDGLSPVSALDTSTLPDTAGSAGDTAAQTGGALLGSSTETAGELGDKAGPAAEGTLDTVQETAGAAVEQGQAAAGNATGSLGGELPTQGLGGL